MASLAAAAGMGNGMNNVSGANIKISGVWRNQPGIRRAMGALCSILSMKARRDGEIIEGKYRQTSSAVKKGNEGRRRLACAFVEDNGASRAMPAFTYTLHIFHAHCALLNAPAGWGA